LRERGPKAVVLKLGDQGCFYCDSDTEIYSAACPVLACDTHCRGRYIQTPRWRSHSLKIALLRMRFRFANAAAAISVTRMGAQASVPARAEVDKFLSEGAASHLG